jgi:dTDP-4-dehydrorhamnose 3,5-epimerase-like enzyme
MLEKWVNFKLLGDVRGSLIALESERNIPFEIKRVYYIFQTKEGVKRGFHAHKELRQLMVCISGTCKLLLDDGNHKEEIYLEPSSKGILIEPMIWHEMYEFSSDCVLMVLANDYYEESDYIRNYESFCLLSK